MAAAEADAPAGTLPLAPVTWPFTLRARDEVAVEYLSKLKEYFGACAHNLELEERRTRHESVARAAFAGKPGAPADAAAWTVRVKAQMTEGAPPKFAYSHPGFCGGRVFSTLASLTRQLGKAVFEESQLLPSQIGDSLPSADSAEAQPAEELDATRAVEQLQRIVAEDGPLAKYAVRLNKALRATVAPVPVASPAPVPAPDDHTDAALQSLSEYLEQARAELSDDVCRAVFVGCTDSGKSSTLNTLLMVTEVDEDTYAKAEHTNSAPEVRLNDGLHRYEALGLIRSLILESQPHLSAEEVQAEMDARVTLDCFVDGAAETDEQKKEAREHYDEQSRQRVLDMAFEGKGRGGPGFIHCVGKGGDVTTRVCTANRFGARYHVFFEMYTEEDLREELFAFLRAERALRAAPESFKGARAKLYATRGAKDDRLLMFGLWNASVPDALLLGGGGDSGPELKKHDFEMAVQAGGLPALFTKTAKPCAKDIPLHGDARNVLDKFRVFTGRGQHLHLDRWLAQQRLQDLSKSGVPGAVRELYLLKKVWAFGPWLLLQGGKEIVDAPGTADPTPLHRKQLRKAVEDAHHLILTAARNLDAPAGTVEVLEECGALQRFQSGDLAMSIVHVHEKQCRGLSTFLDRQPRLDAEAQAAKKSLSVLCDKLLELDDDADPDAVLTDVTRRVRVHTVFPLLFAGLKLDPQRAALAADDNLDNVLQETHGAQLLALFEGLNLNRVAEVADVLRAGPLKRAQEAVDSRITRFNSLANPELRDTVAKLLRPRGGTKAASAKKGILDLLRTSYSGSGSPGLPHNLLASALSTAFDKFIDAVSTDFGPGGACGKKANMAWQRASRRFRDQPARAADAHAAVVGNKPGPMGMNLEHLLLDNLLLPSDAVDTLLFEVRDAVDECADACGALLHEQLHAVGGTDPEQRKLANSCVDDFGAVEGRDMLLQALRKVRNRVTKHLITRMLNVSKSRALRQEIGGHLPQPAQGDPAGVATLVEARRSAMVTALRDDIRAEVNKLQRGMLGDTERALCPVLLPRPYAKSAPAMTAYVNAALEYMITAVDPDSRAAACELLGALHERGIEMAERLDDVVAALRNALADTGGLAAAASHRLDTLVLARSDGGGVPQHDTRAELNVPLNVVCLHINTPPNPETAFYPLLQRRGDDAHMGAVRAALAAFTEPSRHGGTSRLRPLVVAEPGEAPAPADDTLWAALTAQLYGPQALREGSALPERERLTTLLKNHTLRLMRNHYSVQRRATAFENRYGMSHTQYISELAGGTRRPGLLELHHACFDLNVQVCVWIADAAVTRLLVQPRKRAPRCFNLVLARGCDVFLSVRPQRAARLGGVSFSEAGPSVHEYDLLAGERRGETSFREYEQQRLAEKRRNSGNDSSGPDKRSRNK